MANSAAAYFPKSWPAALVVSHQRSGTHFLMNTLASCYGYVSKPFVNFDSTTTALNYYDPPAVVGTLRGAAERPLANIVKAHFMVEFFGDELPRLVERYAVFYVCRDPVSVLLSCWRFMYRWPWSGPRTADPLEYARAEPSAGLLRYQYRQYPDMMRRWAGHVDGWFNAAQSLPGVVFVRYEDLNENFESTVRGFEKVLGRPPQALVRPPRDVNVIEGGPADPTGTGLVPDPEALRRLCRDTIGDTMTRFRY